MDERCRRLTGSLCDPTFLMPRSTSVPANLPLPPAMPRPSRRPSAALLKLLALAAEMRAGGKSWAQVAARLQRSPDTCRHWPGEYPEAWRRLFREAEEHVLADAGAESVAVLRTLLRSKDDRVRRDA